MRTIFLTLICLFFMLTSTSAAPKDTDLVVREHMLKISKQLGVTCTYCHDAKNFKDPKLKTFGVAKEHIRITALLNTEQGFGGKPQISCFTCHHGSAKFQNELK